MPQGDTARLRISSAFSSSSRQVSFCTAEPDAVHTAALPSRMVWSPRRRVTTALARAGLRSCRQLAVCLSMVATNHATPDCCRAVRTHASARRRGWGRARTTRMGSGPWWRLRVVSGGGGGMGCGGGHRRRPVVVSLTHPPTYAHPLIPTHAHPTRAHTHALTRRTRGADLSEARSGV